MSQDELTCRFIADAGLLSALVDAVNEVSYDEAVFEFREDGVYIGCVDPAKVMMSEQFAGADAFPFYEVSRSFKFGMNTERVDELLKIADADSPVEFDLQWESRSFDVQFEDVEYRLPGIAVENVNGKLKRKPDRSKPEYNYNVRADVPVDAIDRANQIVGLAQFSDGVAYFGIGGDDAVFEVGGEGDTDKSKVKVHEAEGFEWVDDPPDEVAHVKVENGYLSEIPKLCDVDTVSVETGADLPIFFDCHRHDGMIESTFVIAPRLANK